MGDTACKMFKGEGYKNKVYDYKLKDVTVSCGPPQCKVTGTIYGPHVTTFHNLVGYTGCQGQPGLHILIHYDTKHFKMVGVNIKDAKASRNPPGIAKYVTAAKGSISLNKDTACKMFKGEGYKNKVYDYKLKDVTVSCGPPQCKVTGTIHGPHVTTFHNLVGYTGCQGQPGLHILIHYDTKHFKMVGVNIKDAKASS